MQRFLQHILNYLGLVVNLTNVRHIYFCLQDISFLVNNAMSVRPTLCMSYLRIEQGSEIPSI